MIFFLKFIIMNNLNVNMNSMMILMGETLEKATGAMHSYEQHKERLHYIMKYIQCCDLLTMINNPTVIKISDIKDFSKLYFIETNTPYRHDDSKDIVKSLINETTSILNDITVDNIVGSQQLIRFVYDKIIDTMINLNVWFIVLLYPDERIIGKLANSITLYNKDEVIAFFTNILNDILTIRDSHITLSLLADELLNNICNLMSMLYIFGNVNKDVKPIIMFIMKYHTNEERFNFFIRDLIKSSINYFQYVPELKNHKIKIGSLHHNKHGNECVCIVNMFWYVLIITEIDNIDLFMKEVVKRLLILMTDDDAGKINDHIYSRTYDVCNRLVMNNIKFIPDL